jgi:hypothetical protein
VGGRRFVLILGAGMLAASSAACAPSPSKPSQPTASARATATTAPSSGAATSFSGDPCSLVSKARAASLLGTTVKAVALNQPAYAGCTYSPADSARLHAAGVLSVAVYPHVDAATWRQLLQRYAQNAGGQQVHGLGDAAVAGQITAQDGRSAYAAVFKGATAFVVVRAVYRGTAPPTRSVVALARDIASEI